MIGSDPSEVEGRHLNRVIVRRVWRFARPYRRALLGFLAVIVALFRKHSKCRFVELHLHFHKHFLFHE